MNTANNNAAEEMEMIRTEVEKDVYAGRIHESRFLDALDARLEAAGFVYVLGAGCTCPDLGEQGHLPACGWQKASPAPQPVPAQPATAWTAWISNAQGERTYETTGHPSRLDALNQAWTDNPDAREIASGYGCSGSFDIQWQSAHSRRADLRVLAASAAIAVEPSRPLPGSPEYLEWLRNERGVRDPQAAHEHYLEELAQRDRQLDDVVSGRVPAGRVPRGWNSVIAALALVALLPLLAAGPAHAAGAATAGAAKAPRQGKSVAGCVKQAGGKWAKQTPAGKWSTVACEPEITLRITDRANDAREGYELRYGSPERCTVWVAEKRADDAKVIGAAYDACIDTMAEKGGA